MPLTRSHSLHLPLNCRMTHLSDSSRSLGSIPAQLRREHTCIIPPLKKKNVWAESFDCRLISVRKLRKFLPEKLLPLSELKMPELRTPSAMKINLSCLTRSNLWSLSYRFALNRRQKPIRKIWEWRLNVSRMKTQHSKFQVIPKQARQLFPAWESFTLKLWLNE